MNTQQFEGILRIVVAAFSTYAAKRGWIPMIDRESFAADLTALVSVGACSLWSYTRHAIPALGVSAFLLIACFAPHAEATDITPKAPVAAPNCLVNCTGAYAFAGLSGEGSNADIVGSGLSNSVFANGAEFNVGAGYQLWNASGKIFAAAEFGGGFLVPAASQAASMPDRLHGEGLIKLGYSLAGLIGTPASPTPFDNLLANVMTPYGVVGIRFGRHGEGFTTGAGIEYGLYRDVTLAVQYLHTNYQNPPTAGATSVNTDNTVRFQIEKHFLY